MVDVADLREEAHARRSAGCDLVSDAGRFGSLGGDVAQHEVQWAHPLRDGSHGIGIRSSAAA
jgi:hypothetical protein